MEGARADLVFTDPSYDIAIDGNVCGLGSVKHREFAFASGEMSKEQFTVFLTVKSPVCYREYCTWKYGAGAAVGPQSPTNGGFLVSGYKGCLSAIGPLLPIRRVPPFQSCRRSPGHPKVAIKAL